MLHHCCLDLSATQRALLFAYSLLTPIRPDSTPFSITDCGNIFSVCPLSVRGICLSYLRCGPISFVASSRFTSRDEHNMSLSSTAATYGQRSNHCVQPFLSSTYAANQGPQTLHSTISQTLHMSPSTITSSTQFPGEWHSPPESSHLAAS